MDVRREDRRSSTAAYNGLSRRRQRATPLRYFLEEEGTRDGVKKRDRGRDLLSRSKRRKEGRFVIRREVGEDTTEESLGDEDGNEIGVSVSSQAVLTNDNQNNRKYLPLPSPMMVARHVPGLKAADEVIGVAVPRKARSNISVRKKKSSSGSNAQLLQLSKSSSSTAQGQEDIEIEIAEVLYGLMKQSSGSSREDYDGKDLLRPGSNDTNASREQKLQADSSPVQGKSVASAVKHESCEVSNEIDASKDVSGPPELQEAEIKRRDSTPASEEYWRTTEEKTSSTEEKLATCSKMDAGLRDSVETREISTLSETESRQEEKCKIDLMAPPPMASSLQEDGYVDLSSGPRSTSRDVKLKAERLVMKDEEEAERSMNKEAVVVELKEMIKNSGDSELKLDSDRPNHESNNEKCTKMRQTDQCRATISKVETTAESGSLPAPFAVAGWPTSQPLGYIPPFQTVAPMDWINSSSTPKQSGLIPVPNSRQKRCATHHHIACNIRLHQQRMEMSQFWPAGAAAAALGETKTSKTNPMHSSDNKIIRNPMHSSDNKIIRNPMLPRDKSHALASCPLYTRKYRSEGSTLSDSAKEKQLVPCHSSQPEPVGNIVNGPAFILSLSQHQAPMGAIVNQSGGSTSAASMTSAPLSASGVSGVAPQASSLPVITAVSFNYPNPAATEAPYLTILPQNGYQFPISTSMGNPPRLTGAKHTQALPSYNGSFYSSQMLQSSQLQQQQQRQQPCSQSLVQSVHHNASSGLSSAHNLPQNQQGPHAGSGKILTSLHSQQKQDTSSSKSLMPETHTASLPKTAAHGHNFAVSFPPNFSIVPSITVGGGANREWMKNLKDGVELIPAQANAISFASFGGSSTGSNLNFSSLAQIPTNLQILPDVTRQGHQVLSAPQATQNKKHRLSEGKTGGSLSNPDDCKKTMEKLTSAGQTLVFDKSVRSLNFVSSSFTGNWPSHSIMSTTSTPMASKSLNSQQQQLQQQHAFHQKHPSGSSRSKTPAANPLSSSYVGVNLSNLASVYTQTQAQSVSSHQNPQRKNSSRAPASKTLHPPFVASTQKDASKPQGRPLQSHNQISFGGNSESTLAQLGHHPRDNHYPSPVAAIYRPDDGSLKSASVSAYANSSVPGSHSQHSDNSTSTGNAQNFSPVCGRNVPSILSTCPSHVSEMKY